RTHGVLRCPQDTRDLVEGEELFGDAVQRRLRGEAHGAAAFRDAFCGRSLGNAREGAPTCHSVDRSHLLECAAMHGGAERITKSLVRVPALPGAQLERQTPSGG